MEDQTLLAAITNFCLYFGVGIVSLVIFKYVYTAITPHNEWSLIKDNKNASAAIALGGAVIGYALALSGAVSNSVGVVDFLIWAGIGLIAQLLAFVIVRFIFMPKIVMRIENDEISAGIIVAAVSVAVGLLNAACMTY